MNDPTPVEIATVAAPIYAAMNPTRASMADAVNAARQLIEAAAKRNGAACEVLGREFMVTGSRLDRQRQDSRGLLM